MLLYVLIALLAAVVASYTLYRRHMDKNHAHRPKNEEHHYTFKIE